MVELLKVGEFRHQKVRDDLINIRALFLQGRQELKEDGLWKGTARQKLLALCDWYWAVNQCSVCSMTPQQSFSHKVASATRRWGALAGVTTMLGLMISRTTRHH